MNSKADLILSHLEAIKNLIHSNEVNKLDTTSLKMIKNQLEAPLKQGSNK